MVMTSLTPPTMCHLLRKVTSSSSLAKISSDICTNLSKRLCTEELAVNLLFANILQSIVVVIINVVVFLMHLSMISPPPPPPPPTHLGRGGGYVGLRSYNLCPVENLPGVGVGEWWGKGHCCNAPWGGGAYH